MGRRKKIAEDELLKENSEDMERGKVEVSFINKNIGNGVFARTPIKKGELILEYRGQLFASDTESIDTTYVYYFHRQKKEYCIDATNNNSLARFVNDIDLKTKQNCKIKMVIVDDVPRLGIYALKDIAKGAELRYDYGCRDAPWRKLKMTSTTTCQLKIFIETKALTDKTANLHLYTVEQCPDDAGAPDDDSFEDKKETPETRMDDGQSVEDELIVEQCPDDAGAPDDDSFEDKKETAETRMDEGQSVEDELIVEQCPNDGGAPDDDSFEDEKEMAETRMVEQCPDDAGAPDDDSFEDEKETAETRMDEGQSVEDELIVEQCPDDAGAPNDDSFEDEKETAETRMGINDSDIDSDFNPAESDADSDDSSFVSSEDESYLPVSRPESIASNGDVGGSLSGTEVDDESVLYPQLSSDKLLKIQGSSNNSRGNLNNKKHACLFCEKLFPNIARHLSNKHAKEHEVAKILILPVKSKERRKAWEELVNKGDFAHNFDVIDKGYGTVIPKYRSRKEDDDLRTLIPCQHCKGFYKKKDLWKHQKFCVVQKSTVLKARHVQAGKLLLPRKSATAELHESVLVKMKDDEIKLTVMTDGVILKHGNSLFEEKGHAVQHHNYISCKLRELARLLLVAKDINTNIKSLLELMKASNWDLLIAAVKKVAEFDEEDHKFGIPSLARKLGHSFKKIAEMEYFDSLRNENSETRILTETFLEMYKLKWSKSIGSIAYSSLEESKYNKPQLLPLVEDVVQLNKQLEENVKSLCGQIETNPIGYYPHLAKVCLAQVILFNRKRSGEAQRMTVKGFLDAKSGGLMDTCNTVKSSLTVFEQSLLKSHLRVEIKGKRGRRVPVLLTEKMVNSLNMLLKYRGPAGVSDKTLLFARPGSAEHPYRGCDVLREFANSGNLKDPEQITSTKLRKQLATLAQILNLKDNDQDILATFQGHDIRVHRKFYRLPESTLQVAKISKLLHCVNNGTISKYKGRDFDSIELEHGETVEYDGESDKSESEEESEQELDRPESPARKRCRTGITKKLASKSETVEYDGESDKSESEEESEQELDRPESPARKRCRTGITKKLASKSGMKQRIYFTSAEKETIAKEFRKEIRHHKVPGKLDILNFMQKNVYFNKYSWTKLKYAVHNMIIARKRKGTSTM